MKDTWHDLSRRISKFSTIDESETFLWPRWIFLRLIGLILILVFVDYLRFGQGMIGPGGVMPFDLFLARSTFLDAPTVLWLWPARAALTAVTAAGLVASVFLFVNLWPRISAVVSWVCLLSLLNVSQEFAVFQHDNLLAESVFFAMFLAPAGFRPGFARGEPPLPLALLLARCLLLRLMIGSGIGKFAGSARWRDFTAMDAHQETSPFPTILGYYDHFLPHWYHVGQILFMIAAELVAPVLAVFGRRGRGVAFALWIVFQCGIELTGNYAFLNLNAIALGFLLLDDDMFARLGSRLAVHAPTGPGPVPARRHLWRLGTYGLLGLSVLLTLARIPVELTAGIRNSWYGSAVARTEPLRLGTVYRLYMFYPARREQIEFRGSDDGGKTWRAYPFRYQNNDELKISPFIAPYFPRFDASLGLLVLNQNEPLLVVVDTAVSLLRGSPEVLGLFKENPFPKHPPDRIATPMYEYSFASLEEHRASGRYWNRRYTRDQTPRIARNNAGTGAVFEK